MTTAADKMAEVMTAEILRQAKQIGGPWVSQRTPWNGALEIQGVVDLVALAGALIGAIQQDAGFHVWADLIYKGPKLPHNDIKDLQETLTPL